MSGEKRPERGFIASMGDAETSATRPCDEAV